MARESMKQMLQGVDYVGRPQLLENNTVKYTRKDGATCFRLHHSDVVILHPDNRVQITSDGWKTTTTADRIRRYSKAALHSDRGVWYVGHGDDRVPFKDGMVIGANGELPKVPQSVAEKQVKLGKQINDFVKLVGANGAAIPLPSNGDCWYCLLRDQNGRTMGEDNPSHLLDHIKEGYCHGALIQNALRAAGHTDISIAHLMHGLGAPRHISIKSALRRYLRRKLSLAV